MSNDHDVPCLVVGATGTTGLEICRLLVRAGASVRALVRRTRPEKEAELAALGVELATGDLKEPGTLAAACRGAGAVISTATGILSDQPGDSIDTVDRAGQIALVRAAASAGVKTFVFLSFVRVRDDQNPLALAKWAVEAELRQQAERSPGFGYTVLRPTYFMESWLAPPLGIDFQAASAVVHGTGDNAIAYISYRDVARFAVAALGCEQARGRAVPVGGPDIVSFNEAVALAERGLGRAIRRNVLSMESLEDEARASSRNPVMGSIAQLRKMYALHRDDDMRAAAELFGIAPASLAAVSDYIEAACRATAASSLPS